MREGRKNNGEYEEEKQEETKKLLRENGTNFRVQDRQMKKKNVCLHEQSHVHLNSSAAIPPPSPVLIALLLFLCPTTFIFERDDV